MMEDTVKTQKEKRIYQRRLEVMETAYRARQFTTDELTKEASNFIKFCLSLEKIRKKRSRKNND